MLKDQKFQYLKNQIVFKGNVYTQRPDLNDPQKIRSRSLNASLNTQGFSLLNSESTKRRELEEQETDAKRGPGMYYQDPMQERLRNLRMHQEAKRMVK